MVISPRQCTMPYNLPYKIILRRIIRIDIPQLTNEMMKHLASDCYLQGPVSRNHILHLVVGLEKLEFIPEVLETSSCEINN